MERSQLELGLEYSFTNNSKNQRKFLAANLESIYQRVDKDIDQGMKEEFHEFFRGYTDIFIKNISNTKDHTYNNLKGLIKNKNLCILSGDKDSCVIIMNKQDYMVKLEEMLKEHMSGQMIQQCMIWKLFKASYTETSEITLATTK